MFKKQKVKSSTRKKGKDNKVKLELTNKQIEVIFHTLIERFHDDVTGLYTRDLFLLQAEDIIKASPITKQYGILAYNLHDFRTTNALYGEEKCNELLKFIASKLQSLYEKEPLIGCFGGDHFVVLIESSNKKKRNIQYHPERIMKSSPIPNQILKVGLYAPIDKNQPVVLSCARAFSSINKIKDQYNVCYAEYDESSLEEEKKVHELEENMESALKNGEFHVFYQPKHATRSEYLAGAEALVRWKRPDGTLISPNDFIPIFEKNGFITELDLYILDRVCRDQKRWLNENLEIVPVSVNFSRKDFMDEELVEKQIQIVDSYGIDHKYIHYEVTETECEIKIEDLIKLLKRLKSENFYIEMDDFGSGYSSLGALSDLPIDVIKIDKKLIDKIEKDDAIVLGIIYIGKRRELKIVAEGVENRSQLEILRNNSCDLIQGFYFSEPISVDGFENYLKSYQGKIE
ncbi:MAG: EAL domain-containing protein [Treponema sp.]|nr:EAL domain-containing protein [Treponema sp.]